MQPKQNNILFSDFEKSEKELLLVEIEKLEKELAIEDALFDDAFEWILEFPELLDNDLNWKGFSVIIGNPPYIDHKKLAKFSNFFAKRYKTYSSTGDISIYFFELGNDLLQNHGFLNYINTNKFFRTEYGKKCRDLLTKNQLHFIINFEQVPIFKEALVSSTIICNQKITNDFNFTFAEFAKEPAPEKNFNIEIQKRNKSFNGSNLNSRVWSFADDNVQKIKTIIESKGRPIKDIETIEIFRGVTTGFDDAFIIKQDTYDALISKDKKNKEIIKPLLKGKDIKKYFSKFDNLWLLYIPWHFPIQKDNSISGASLKAEKLLQSEYPVLFDHLNNFKHGLSNRNKAETGITYEWYSLQRCAASYIDCFDKDKLIWALTADKWGFTLDTEKHYLTSGGFLLVSKQISLKYILAILNSDLMKFYFSQIGVMTAGGAYTLKKATIERFPLIEINKKEQEAFINLVDKILVDKHNNIDTIKSEFELNKLIYKLYDIKDEEVQIIDNLK